MKRRDFLRAAAGAGTASALPGWAAERRRPNFLVIIADDLGWGDLGCYGRDDVATPAIDSLAHDGLKFEQAYSNSSVCSPTRVALMTGRYQNRLPVGQEEPLGPGEIGLEASEPTLPSQLRAAGYQTALIGKWHLGMADRFNPLRHGYQHFWGLRGGGADYFTHSMRREGDSRSDIWDGETRIEQVGYLTDLLGARAVDEVRRMSAASDPFLLSLHFTAPHWPWEGPDDEAISKTLKDVLHHDGGTVATYRKMLASLDANVAKVLNALKASGKARDTLVIFTSDNGGERFSKSWPFSGMKGELLEGGIRVPLLARWPGVVRGGTITQQTAMTMDFLPTLLDAAGAVPDASRPPDGMSLVPSLRDPANVRERSLFWRYRAHGQAAARRGRFKFLRIEGKEYLFDVIADPQERGNLSERETAAFNELKSAWEIWNDQMIPYTEKSSSYSNKAQRSLPDRY